MIGKTVCTSRKFLAMFKKADHFFSDVASCNSPLAFISHSMSLLQLRFLFEPALPSLLSNLNNKCLVDVGSRLGAVLYAASIIFLVIVSPEIMSQLVWVPFLLWYW